MNKFRFTVKILAIAIFTFAFASLAQAQATRTWVSGVGDDVNPCSRTAPCKTFAGAISKTASNGEIDCLDPGGFGAVTITKSITIDGTDGAGFGSILAALVNGVIVNDSATGSPGTINVTLRNLSINGAGNGTNGIRFLSGKSLNVEGCQIFGFLGGTGFGIDVSHTLSGKELHVRDTNIFNCTTGVRITTSTGFFVSTFNNVSIEKVNDDAMRLEAGGFADVRDSVISFAVNQGIEMTGGANSGVNLINGLIAHCGTGIAVGGSTSRITHSSILQNTTGVSFAGGSLRSAGDSFFDGNVTPFSGGTPTFVAPQ
jgi:hypothetical protein